LPRGKRKRLQIDKRDKSAELQVEEGWKLDNGVMKGKKRSWSQLSRGQLLFMYIDEHG